MSTHWKQLANLNYLGAYSIESGDLVVTIKSVSKQMVKGPEGRDEECIVATLDGQKPMILNKTNCKTISKLFGTPYIEEWSGKKVSLYVAKVKAFGEVVEALRVRATLPTLPELTPSHEKWAAAGAALKAGQVTVESLRKNYKLSEENLKLLQS